VKDFCAFSADPVPNLNRKRKERKEGRKKEKTNPPKPQHLKHIINEPLRFQLKKCNCIYNQG